MASPINCRARDNIVWVRKGEEEDPSKREDYPSKREEDPCIKGGG